MQNARPPRGWTRPLIGNDDGSPSHSGRESEKQCLSRPVFSRIMKERLASLLLFGWFRPWVGLRK